jgi:hypothetical protein
VGEAAKLHNIVRKCPVHEFDHEVQTNDWLHPTDAVRITEQQNEHPVQIFTEVNKSEHEVRAGIVIFIRSNLVHQFRYMLKNRCSKNEAE